MPTTGKNPLLYLMVFLALTTWFGWGCDVSTDDGSGRDGGSDDGGTDTDSGGDPDDESRTGDPDGDGVINMNDNCPDVANEDQKDRDGDTIGDACDNCVDSASWISPTEQIPADQCPVTYDDEADNDDDGWTNGEDNCPELANPLQTDDDGDGHGDLCDNCPATYNQTQPDTDGDGTGDHCDPDYTLVEVCATGGSVTNQVIPNLLFVVDRSGSMDDPACSGCQSRRALWNDAVDAIAPQLGNGSFNLGSASFQGDTCDQQPTSRMAMTVAETADLAATFASASSFGDGSGATPTGAALEGVRTGQLYNLAGDSEPDRNKAVVLVTDGEPTTCPDTGGDVSDGAVQRAMVNARGLAAAGVPVYLLGFSGIQDNVMNAMAWAGDPANAAAAPNRTTQCEQTCEGGGWGNPEVCTPVVDTDCWCTGDYAPAGCWRWSDLGQGGSRLWFEVNSTTTIVNALEAIAARTVSCEMSITFGDDVDTDLHEVSIVTSSGVCTGSPATDNSCNVPEGSTDGYVIAIDDLALTGAVSLVGTWCTYLKSLVQDDANAQVDVSFGCACKAELEVCDNDRDDNCNGLVDEGCGSTPPEVCGNQVDDDGDGNTDEGCPIIPIIQ